jgi:hypothetical protein
MCSCLLYRTVTITLTLFACINLANWIDSSNLWFLFTYGAYVFSKSTILLLRHLYVNTLPWSTTGCLFVLMYDCIIFMLRMWVVSTAILSVQPVCLTVLLCYNPCSITSLELHLYWLCSSKSIKMSYGVAHLELL